MTNASSLRALQCPNCGAPVRFESGSNTVQCAFCQSVIERTEEAPAPEDEGHIFKIDLSGERATVQRAGPSAAGRHFKIKMAQGQPVMVEVSDFDWPLKPAGAAQPARAPSARPASPPRALACLPLAIVGVVILIPLVIVLATLPGIGHWLRTAASGDLGSLLTALPSVATRINVDDDLRLVPSADDAPPDIVALTSQYPPDADSAEYRLVALSGEAPRLLWQSASLGGDVYDAPILADEARVYTAAHARVLAIDRATGATAWEAALADEIAYSVCRECLRLTEGFVLALTADGTLHAFEAATGRPAWTFQAVQDSPRGLYLLAGRPAFMDEDENDDGVLRVFDPASGAMQAVQPVCQAESRFPSYADWTTPLTFSPSGDDFYITFNSSPTCVQRWSVEPLRLMWGAEVEGGYNFFSDRPRVAADDALYLTSWHDELVRIDAATGEVRSLFKDEDYQFAPLFVHEGRLLVHAVRQRGTQRHEVWSVDGATGERLWAYDFGEDPPAESTSIISDDATVWTTHPTADGLLVLRFWRAPDDVSHAVRLTRLDWATGQPEPEREVRLGLDTIILSAPTVVGWTGDTLWMAIERQVLALDTASGQITYRWP